MIRRILVCAGVIVATVIFLFGSRWFEMNPRSASNISSFVPTRAMREELPARNKEIIKFIELKGATIAPTYEASVCTEFVIRVIEEFTPLTKHEKKAIRIITDDPLHDLIAQDAKIIRGVCTALTSGKKGVSITVNEVKPGDFVQFWNTAYGFSIWGHCGVVKEIVPFKSVTLYSSHPITNGYGIHEFEWPDKIYFVRMK